jgi:hypothetical protein
VIISTLPSVLETRLPLPLPFAFLFVFLRRENHLPSSTSSHLLSSFNYPHPLQQQPYRPSIHRLAQTFQSPASAFKASGQSQPHFNATKLRF